MTYFQVLATFILPPMLILLAAAVLRRRRYAPAVWLPFAAVGLHVFLAVAYTTPWDNYLVATGVWWYDPRLVTGLRIGWVPIEEYVFFVLQTLMTGFWTVLLTRTEAIRVGPASSGRSLRLWSTLALAAVWAAAALGLVFDRTPLTYANLILVWALIPWMIQTAFGADILLKRRRTAAAGILLPTLYLWWVDSLAITAGTWTINPEKTTGLLVGSLPIEEMLFFLMTNVIIVCGITLILAPEARERLAEMQAKWGLDLIPLSKPVNSPGND